MTVCIKQQMSFITRHGAVQKRRHQIERLHRPGHQREAWTAAHHNGPAEQPCPQRPLLPGPPPHYRKTPLRPLQSNKRRRQLAQLFETF